MGEYYMLKKDIEMLKKDGCVTAIIRDKAAIQTFATKNNPAVRVEITECPPKD